jgi:hypothetical protein
MRLDRTSLRNGDPADIARARRTIPSPSSRWCTSCRRTLPWRRRPHCHRYQFQYHHHRSQLRWRSPRRRCRPYPHSRRKPCRRRCPPRSPRCPPPSRHCPNSQRFLRIRQRFQPSQRYRQQRPPCRLAARRPRRSPSRPFRHSRHRVVPPRCHMRRTPKQSRPLKERKRNDSWGRNLEWKALYTSSETRHARPSSCVSARTFTQKEAR